MTFVKKLIEAVKDNEDLLLFIGLGGMLEQTSFAPIPDNVILKSSMPQLFLLSNADCSINHGGIHTINECIHYAVPMLIYSGKKYDQNGCAARFYEWHRFY